MNSAKYPSSVSFLHLRQFCFYLLFSLIFIVIYQWAYLKFLKDINYFNINYFGIRFYIIIISAIFFQAPIRDYWHNRTIKNVTEFLLKSKANILIFIIYIVLTYLFFVYVFYGGIELLHHDLKDLMYINMQYVIKFTVYLFINYFFTFVLLGPCLPIYVFFNKFVWKKF